MAEPHYDPAFLSYLLVAYLGNSNVPVALGQAITRWSPLVLSVILTFSRLEQLPVQFRTNP